MDSTEIRLASRPERRAKPTDFAAATVPVPAPGPGQVQVRNSFLSVDPYMRGRMNDVPSYVPPFALGEALTGGAVGRVVASESSDVPVGALVSSMFGWREAFTVDAAAVQVLPEPPQGVAESAYLGVLGMPGMTAWVGVTQIAPVHEGDAVFVSGASGAVGSVAGQLARARGASLVVGSAGAPEKVTAVRDEFGFDDCFSHLDGEPLPHLRRLAPNGIDMYFDNVGGAQLAAALVVLRPFGRAALCGAISTGYDGTPGAPVATMGLVVGKRLTLRGFIVSDHTDLQSAFLAEVGALLAGGRLVFRETVAKGIASAPEAFLALFEGGGQIGKVVVAV
ncbi:MAG TPA: NADP-dependent oxidoreductase [Mycobacteriales bacterium]|jgi:hypothetical protein|nr:NADP-dependent oxidoreductase [Mycobacteriales bacterium]